MPTFTETIPVNGQNLGLYLSLPDGDGPFPSVVVGMHAGGTDAFIHAMCDRLSEAGYVAAAPDLYHPWASMTREVQASSKTWK